MNAHLHHANTQTRIIIPRSIDDLLSPGLRPRPPAVEQLSTSLLRPAAVRLVAFAASLCFFASSVSDLVANGTESLLASQVNDT